MWYFFTASSKPYFCATITEEKVQSFLKRQYWLSCIVFWWKYSYKTKWFKPYCLLVKGCFKDYMGWSIFSSGQNFWKRKICVESYCLLVQIFLKHYMGWIILHLCQNVWKRQYGLNHIVFCSKFSKKIIWIERYCPVVKTFFGDYMDWTLLPKFSKKAIWIEPHFLFIKIFSKDNMDETVKSLGQNFLKRQFGLNHIVFWSKLSEKTIWIEPYYLLMKIF